MTHTALAALVAVVSAAAYGLSGALQHRADRQAPLADTMSPRIVLEVLHRPMWLTSLLAVAVALAGQALALSMAPLVLVQPILVSGAVFGAIFAAVLARHRPDLTVVLGAAGAVAGLSALLVLAQPSEPDSHSHVGLSDAWPLAVGLAALLALCLALARHPPTPVAQTISLAVATGVMYGINAGLAKVALDRLSSDGFVALLTSWPLWAVAVIGPLGFVLNQQAFTVGTAASPAIAIITVLDPLVGLAIGVLWLGESLRHDDGRLVGEILAFVVVIASIAVVAHRAPQAAAQEQAG